MTEEFHACDAGGAWWSAPDPAGFFDWADPREPVFVLARDGESRAAEVMTPQPFMPLTESMLRATAARLRDTLERRR